MVTMKSVRSYFGMSAGGRGAGEKSGAPSRGYAENERLEKLLESVRGRSLDIYSEHVDQSSTTREKLHELSSIIAELYPLAQQACRDSAQLKESCGALKAELAQVQSERKSVKADRDRYASRIDDSEKKVKALSGELSYARNVNQDLESSLEYERRCSSDLSIQLSRTQRQLEEEIERRKLLEARSAEMEGFAYDANAARLQSESDIARLESEMEVIGRNHDEQTSRLVTEESSHQMTRSALEAAVREREALSAQLQEAEAEVEKVRGQYDELLARSKREGGELDARLSAVTSRAEFLEGLLARQKEEVRKCHEHIRNLERSNRSLLAKWEHQGEGGRQDGAGPGVSDRGESTHVPADAEAARESQATPSDAKVLALRSAGSDG